MDSFMIHSITYVLGALKGVSVTHTEHVFDRKSHDIKHSWGLYNFLLYDWRESCLLIGQICLHKSLCLPQNWS